MSISGFSASKLAGCQRISERPQKPVPACNNVMFWFVAALYPSFFTTYKALLAKILVIKSCGGLFFKIKIKLNFPQSWPHQDLLSRNVLGLAMRMFPPVGGIIRSAIDRWSDFLARIEIIAILVHYQPSYNTSHTMKFSDPLLLADVTLLCKMYRAGKVDISSSLAIPGFPQSYHTVGKPSANAGLLCSEA